VQRAIPSARRNRMRLRFLSARRALDAIVEGGQGLVTRSVAFQILQALDPTIVPVDAAGAGDVVLPDVEVDPTLLCLYCLSLELKLPGAELTTITSSLVAQTPREDVFRTF